MGESGEALVLDRTNSMTGTSAHCTARWRIEVPSVRVAWKEGLPPSPSAGADCSRMALDIAAVSPFRSDSNTRNSLTDCSMEAGFAMGELGGGWKAGDVAAGSSCAERAFGTLFVERWVGCFLERVRLCPPPPGWRRAWLCPVESWVPSDVAEDEAGGEEPT